MSKKLKILILGSEGFIGQNAVRFFVSKDYSVYGADIVLKQAENYFLINPERSDFSTIFIQHKFDACINATGAANVQLSFAYPASDYILNVANVFEILNSIREHNPDCKFINLSSAAVYGNPLELPIKENARIKPLSPYGYHKLHSEMICAEFHEFFKLHTISARIFSAFGEGLQKQIFWDLNRKIKATGNQIEVFGTGEESRDFIYIDDILLALLCIVEKAEFNGGVMNIASGKETTIKEAVSLFLKLSGTNKKVKFVGDLKVGDPINWCADIAKLDSLGFRPQFSLEHGLSRYCNWLREKQ